MPNWEEIRRDWETTKITFAALADKHDVKLGTLKSRRSREGWSRNKDATKKKKDATISKKMQPKKERIEPIVESDDLTDKQRLFCIYYIKSFNQTMAAIKAGYSRNSAHVEGSRLIRIPKVAEEIRRLKGEMQQGIFIDAMDVLNKYIQIAFADITDFVEFGSVEMEQRHPETGKVMLDANFKPITYKMSQVDFKNDDIVDGSLISEVKQGKDGVSVKLLDKMKALDMLSRYFDVLSDNDKKRLQEEKLKAEIIKVKAETNTDEPGESKTIIVTGEDEMRRVLDGKSSD
ncbi:terminase small subunit [Sporosarcina sp. FSL K6-1540]|uniref:terminase small subunit n=1 Tax=Sporosarcina sp. FSL K6-1540 TaxID=2921555 RepID=UPI003159EF0C